MHNEEISEIKSKYEKSSEKNLQEVKLKYEKVNWNVKLADFI